MILFTSKLGKPTTTRLTADGTLAAKAGWQLVVLHTLAQTVTLTLCAGADSGPVTIVRMGAVYAAYFNVAGSDVINGAAPSAAIELTEDMDAYTLIPRSTDDGWTGVNHVLSV